jgi:hypothetical protein
MIIYYLLYFLIFASGILILYTDNNGIVRLGKSLSKKREAIFVIVSFCLMLYVQGFRGFYDGADTKNYLDIFDLILDNKSNINIRKLDFENIEIGYVALNLMIAKISTDYRFFIFAISLIMLVLHITYLWKYSKNIYLSIVLLLGFNIFYTSMVSLRQYLAIGVIYWSLQFALEKKYIRALILALIAFMLHNSSILLCVPIILYILLKKKENLWIPILMALLLSLPLVNVIWKIVLALIPKYNFYNAHTVSGSGKLKSILALIYLMVLIYTALYKKVRNKRVDLYCVILCFAIYVTLLGKYIPLAHRVGLCFDYVFILLVPELAHDSNPYGRNMRYFFYAISLPLYIYLTITNGWTWNGF